MSDSHEVERYFFKCFFIVLTSEWCGLYIGSLIYFT